MFKKIAVPLDGSVLAEKALPYAVKLANLMNSQLLLLRVAEVPKLVSDSLDEELALIKEAEAYLNEVTKAITGRGTPVHIDREQVQSLVSFGDKNQEIAEIVPFENADLIVMTTHGRTGFSRLLLGSVAAKILQKAGVPVLLIKPEAVQKKLQPKEVIAAPLPFNPGVAGTSMVVTLDGTPQAEAILLPALELARKINAVVYLLQVIGLSIPPTYGELGLNYRFDPDQEIERIAKEAHLYLDKIIGENAKFGITLKGEVLVGNPATEILQYVSQLKPTILAMATHARSAIGQIVMGSVAEEVLNKSHLPVLMVHTAPQKALAETGKEVVSVS
jgi:nucleotide-binding universal stress UspA family protein